MKHAKALLSEEELLVRDKVSKASKRASEAREQTLHRQEQNQTHMISINTYHLACTKGSALQCCLLNMFFCFYQRSPLDVAAAYGHEEVQYLIRAADPNMLAVSV